MAVNKVVYGTTVLVDLTGDTVTPSTLMQGYTAHDKSGALITGTASGGGDTYTLTTIVPEQTFTAQELNNSYQVNLTYTAGLEDGESYLVTFDGEQYVCECGLMWGTDYMAGDIVLLWDKTGLNAVYPFGIDYVPSEPGFSVGVYDLNQHTIKVEHLEFVDGPLNLIAKSVTANGTYNASSDNADGYSSVTVNISGGGSETYRLDNIVPEQTVACTTLNQNNSYYGMLTFDSGIEDSEQYLVTFDGTEYVCEGYVPEANATGVGDVRVVNTNAAQYLITPFFIEYGSLGMGLIVRGSGTHTVKVDKLTFIDDGETFTTKSITENGTYSASSDNADGYSSVTVNVPSGGGTSLPTFSATIDSSDQVTSITCDMSYAECAALLAEDEPTANVVVTLPDSSTQTWGACGFQDQGYIWYVVLEPSSMEPVAEIEYASNGTIEVTAPPTYIQSLSVTQNGTYSGLYRDVTVNVPSGSSMNVQTAQSTTRSTSTSYTEVISLTCDTAGTYDVYWTTFRTSTSGTWGSQLYLDNTAYGTAQTGSWSNNVQNIHLTGVSISANQEVNVRVRSRGSNYYAYCGQLTIVQTA